MRRGSLSRVGKKGPAKLGRKRKKEKKGTEVDGGSYVRSIPSVHLRPIGTLRQSPLLHHGGNASGAGKAGCIGTDVQQRQEAGPTRLIRMAPADRVPTTPAARPHSNQSPPRAGMRWPPRRCRAWTRRRHRRCCTRRGCMLNLSWAFEPGCGRHGAVPPACW